MEFGKVDRPQNVDFTLAPDPPGNALILAGGRIETRWSVGLTGWGDAGWRGDLYPAGTKTKDQLKHYANSFDCIELNPSFYHPLAIDLVRKWASVVPAGFRFCPKLWQGLSHQDAPQNLRVIKDIQDVHQGFGQHLGPAFLQLPPRIGAEHTEWILSVLDVWDTEQKLFLEVRNPVLATDQKLISYLVQRGIGLVITDVAGYRALAHMRLTVPRLFLRFVASGFDIIDRQRITDWMARLRQWHESGLEEACIFLHHADNLLAPALARTWMEIGNESGSAFFSMKTPLHYRGVTQGELFD